MFSVFMRLRFLKYIILVLLGIQTTVFIGICVLHRDHYISFVRNVTGISAVEIDKTKEFLSTYKDYCEQNLLPKSRNVAELQMERRNVSAALCECVPDALYGRFSMSFEPPQIGELELELRDMAVGGSWTPRRCIPRHRVAVIIPFRDREEHLRILLGVIHPMMQRQLIQYTVFIVEQLQPAVFNKASLMNVGFVEARDYADFDCFIFHDVDMLPEDDRNFYVCSSEPRHVGSHISKWNYKIPYDEIFGGVTAFRREHFERANGFSNQYYGWGGEDDDMYNRIKASNMSVLRFSETVARYSMIKHQSDTGNPYNTKSNVAWRVRPKHYAVDGLNSLRYRIVATEARPLYTWLLVSLPPHPTYFKSVDRGYPSDASTLRTGNCWLALLFVVLCAEFVTHRRHAGCLR